MSTQGAQQNKVQDLTKKFEESSRELHNATQKINIDTSNDDGLRTSDAKRTHYKLPQFESRRQAVVQPKSNVHRIQEESDLRLAMALQAEYDRFNF